MERINSIQEAKKKMETSVNYYKCRIEAWEAVQRQCKKNGEPFAVLSKNFSNCDFSDEYGKK